MFENKLFYWPYLWMRNIVSRVRKNVVLIHATYVDTLVMPLSQAARSAKKRTKWATVHQSVTRKTCSTKGNSEGPRLPSEATKHWNWKERRSTPPSVPAKRKKVDKDNSSGGKKNYTCIQCLSLVVKGEREERTAYFLEATYLV